MGSGQATAGGPGGKDGAAVHRRPDSPGLSVGEIRPRGRPKVEGQAPRRSEGTPVTAIVGRLSINRPWAYVVGRDAESRRFGMDQNLPVLLFSNPNRIFLAGRGAVRGGIFFLKKLDINIFEE